MSEFNAVSDFVCNAAMLDVEVYADNSTYQRKTTIQAISNHGHHLKWTSETEEIMDLGCGDGSITEHVLKPFIFDHTNKCIVHAVDISEMSIRHARKNHNTSCITFDVMDLNSEEDTTKFADTIDKIFSFQCLHWCPDKRIAFGSIGRMLKKGGSVFATLSTGQNPACFVFKVLSAKWTSYMTGHFRKLYFSPICQVDRPDLWLRTILKDCNFNVITCKLVTENFKFSDFESLKGFLLAFHGLCDHLPPSLQEEFFEELKICPQSLTFPCEYVLVIAKKM